MLTTFDADTSSAALHRLFQSAGAVTSYNQLPFDPYLTLHSGRWSDLERITLPEIQAARARAPNAQQADLQRRLLPLVIANVAVAAFHEGGVHYSRNENKFAGRAYEPDWLRSRPLIGTIDRLAAAGYLDSYVANRGSKVTAESVAYAKPKLIQALAAYGITSADIDYRLDLRPALILKDADGRPTPIDWTDPEAQRLQRDVRIYNAYMQGVQVGLRQHGRTVILPFQPVVRHCKPTLQLGGRFFRGVAQGIRKEERPGLLIGGEPTVELDYSGFAVRAIYHLKGLVLEGDPYAMPLLKRYADWFEVPESVVRTDIKLICNMMLNAKSKQNMPISDDRLTSLKAPRRHAAEIAAHHRAIGDAFFSSYGFTLMHYESRISNAILMDGVASDIPVLPIHDGYVVRMSDHDWLMDKMICHYRSIIGGQPIVH